MANKAKWEEKYEEFKKYDKVEDLEKKDLEYKRQMAGIKDTNSSEYKEIAKKSKNISKQKNSFSKIKSNIPMVEKIKERRDTYQELLDELLATEKENESLIQTRIDLDDKSRKLDAELAELNQMIDNCKAIMKSDKESENNKAVAAKMLKVHEERKNKNQLEFSETQLKLSKHLEIPLKQVPQNDIKELKENIDKDNKACELLMEGKTMKDVIAEQNKTVKPEPTKPEPKKAKPATREAGAGEPTTGKPEAEEPTTGEPGAGEPTTGEPGTGEPTTGEPGTGGPTTGEPGTKGKGKLIGVKAEGKTYTFEYENGQEKVEKMGIFRNLAEKVKLAVNRNNYGITLREALQADTNIVKNISEEDKEMYLSFITEKGNGDCFNIEYADKEGRQAKRLEAVTDKWVKLLEAEIKKDELLDSVQKGVDQKRAENAQAIYNAERHDARQSKYDEMFGPGFDQSENPPQPPIDKETQEEVAETVNEILNENQGGER